MRRICSLPACVLALALLLPCAVHAQAEKLVALCDFNSFAYKDGATAVEFAVQFRDRGLTFRKGKDGAEIGRMYTRFIFDAGGGVEPTAVEWETVVPRPADAEAASPVVTQQSVMLTPGTYKVSMFYADAWEPQRNDSAVFTVNVPAFGASRLQVSDLEIAREIYPSEDTQNPFVKNGYYVLPDVGSEIAPPFLVLNTYLEIYNADKVPTSEFHVSYRLANEQKKVFYERQVPHQRPAERALLELQSIPLDSLPSGTYHIMVKVYNGLARFSTDSVMVYRKFRVSNPAIDSVMRAATRVAGFTMRPDTIIDPMYAGLKEEELNEEFAKVRYIAVAQELDLWESMSGREAKGRYLTAFWGRRDQTPLTPENEERENYYKRLEEARNLYAAPMSPKGWDSDRGRILLQYGRPDNIDRHFQDFNRKPYEVWTYSSMSYEFAFVDRTQTGFYKLVHSTAPGEIRFENWEREYTPLNKNWKDN